MNENTKETPKPDDGQQPKSSAPTAGYVITEIKVNKLLGCSISIYNDIRFVRINDHLSAIEFYYCEYNQPWEWREIHRFSNKSELAKIYENKFNVKFEINT